jgi:hypothetical protein
MSWNQEGRLDSQALRIESVLFRGTDPAPFSKGVAAEGGRGFVGVRFAHPQPITQE